MGGFSFSVDADGNPGYRKPGADTVTPFKSGGKLKVTQIFSGDSRTAHEISVKDYPGYENFTLDNFFIKSAYIRNWQPTILPNSQTEILSSYNPTTGILYLNMSRKERADYVFGLVYTVCLVTVE